MRCASGFSLLELLIALALGVTLAGAGLGVLQRSRVLFAGNESLAQVHDAARHALAVLVSDIEHAGFYGLDSSSRVEVVRNGSPLATDDALRQPTPAEATPAVAGLPTGTHDCGVNFALDVFRPVQGTDNGHALTGTCAPTASARGVRDGTDTLTMRHASLDLAEPRDGRLQMYAVADVTTPLRILADGDVDTRDDRHELRDLEVHTYYIANGSVGQPDLPALRVKSLTESGGRAQFRDEEVMPGIEDLQVELGVVANDGDAPAYVSVDSPRTRHDRIVAVRLWLRVRAETPDAGAVAGPMAYANTAFEPAGDERRFRRLLVSRTIALRNAVPGS